MMKRQVKDALDRVELVHTQSTVMFTGFTCRGGIQSGKGKLSFLFHFVGFHHILQMKNLWREAAKHLEMYQTTPHRLRTDRGLIAGMESNGVNRERIGIKPSFRPQVDIVAIKWIRANRDKGAIISRRLICAKAEAFADLLGYRDIRTYRGWLDRLKRRPTVRRMLREARSAHITSRDKWIKKKCGHDYAKIMRLRTSGMLMRPAFTFAHYPMETSPSKIALWRVENGQRRHSQYS